jgi:hypothetical protein
VHDETEVRVDHPLLGRAIPSLDALGERDLLRRVQQRVAADLVQEELERVRGRGQRGSLEALVGSLELVLVVFEEGVDFGVLQSGADGEFLSCVGMDGAASSPRGRGGKAARVQCLKRMEGHLHFRL